MEKIALDLFTKYAFLANLTAYRSKLLFNEYKCDLKNNDYLVRLHELDPNSKEDVILADWQKNIKTAVLADELFLLRKDEDYHYPHTKFYRLIDGKEELCHVKNTGRLRELLVPQARVFVEESDNPRRKTRFDLVQVYKGDRLVNIDSQMPNYLVREFFGVIQVVFLKKS